MKNGLHPEAGMSIYHTTHSQTDRQRCRENEEQGVIGVGCQRDKRINVRNEEKCDLARKDRDKNSKLENVCR